MLPCTKPTSCSLYYAWLLHVSPGVAFLRGQETIGNHVHHEKLQEAEEAPVGAAVTEEVGYSNF